MCEVRITISKDNSNWDITEKEQQWNNNMFLFKNGNYQNNYYIKILWLYQTIYWNSDSF